MPIFSPPDSFTFKALLQHQSLAKTWRLRTLFEQDAHRFDKLSGEAAGLFMDYSKNIVDPDTIALLCALAREAGVEQQRDAMFAGAACNVTERRAALHTALRRPRQDSLLVNGVDVVDEAHKMLDRIGDFTERVRSGAWLGHTDQAITDVVNIGIGGSYLGPKMTCEALCRFAHPRLRMHFVSNVDGHDLAALLPHLDPATTLFIVASKTFNTAETMTNAHSARAWLQQHAADIDLARHFVAVSTNREAVAAFGIAADNMFPFRDWVGGRYSIWSSIGLPLALCIGIDHFRALLAGAHAMDTHFREAPLEKNLPALLALIGIWNRNFLGYGSLSIAPYHHDLASFPAYLQQLEMESNGKQVHTDGTPVIMATCPVIWGDTGTNGQHAYFQLLHQGSDVVPVDFIAVLKPAHQLPHHQEKLLANCFAQSEALMRGKTAEEARHDMHAQGLSDDEIARLLPHRTFAGNRPSTTLLLDELTPAALGALIALYEHKVFVQGAIWGINSFDQWGVELGKTLAKNIEAELTGDVHAARHDSSTNGLIARARQRLRPDA